MHFPVVCLCVNSHHLQEEMSLMRGEGGGVILWVYMSSEDILLLCSFRSNKFSPRAHDLSCLRCLDLLTVLDGFHLMEWPLNPINTSG